MKENAPVMRQGKDSTTMHAVSTNSIKSYQPASHKSPVIFWKKSLAHSLSPENLVWEVLHSRAQVMSHALQQDPNSC